MQVGLKSLDTAIQHLPGPYNTSVKERTDGIDGWDQRVVTTKMSDSVCKNQLQQKTLFKKTRS